MPRITYSKNFDLRYLKLDQTTPQTVINGVPIFDAGLTSNSTVNISVPTATSEALILQTTDDDVTKCLFRTIDANNNELLCLTQFESITDRYAQELNFKSTAQLQNSSCGNILWTAVTNGIDTAKIYSGIKPGPAGFLDIEVHDGTSLKSFLRIDGSTGDYTVATNSDWIIPTNGVSTLQKDLASNYVIQFGGFQGAPSTYGGLIWKFGTGRANAGIHYERETAINDSAGIGLYTRGAADSETVRRILIGSEGTVTFESTATAIVPVVIKAAPSQTANSTEWQNSSSGVLAYISATGGALFSDKVVFTQTDGNEYIDSLADGYMDYGATTAHRFDRMINQPGIFGGIHVHDNSTAQSIATGDTYVKITAFSDNEPSTNVTADAANDKITITKTGIYRVEGSFSFSSGTANVEFFGSAFLDGTELDNIHWTRKVGAAGDVGNTGLTGFIDVTSVPVDLDFRMRHDNGGSVNITISYANLNISYLGET